jgi:putative acetyltransferase
VVSIRPAVPADHAAIREVVKAAFTREFGKANEHELVDALRADGAALVELVADDAGEVVGHILFSAVVTDTGQAFAALAPVAVKPGLQKSGTGSALCRAGLEACRALRQDAVIVLGHPAYYPRFGFSAEAAKAVASPFSGRPSFMALALAPGALDRPVSVTYHRAFG